jgi:acetylornithine deacetylase/succinyl-diaminopimelate desuccinylase-like protein
VTGPLDPAVVALHAALAPARTRLADDDTRTVAEQCAVTAIPAPTGAEGPRAAWMAERFVDLGLREVRIDAAGNVVAHRDGSRDAAPIVVCAHLDTVFPADTDLTVRTVGPRITTPGIGDNGRGLAGLLALARAVDGVHLRPERPVVFAATTGEEGAGDLAGARRLFADRDCAAAIALDGTGDRRVVHQAVGSRRFRVTVRGPGGHSWAQYGVANAVHAVGDAIARIARIARVAVPAAPSGALSVTRVGGGLAVNAIPAAAWCEVDARAVDAAVLDALDAAVRGAVSAAVAAADAWRTPDTPALVADVAVIGDRPAGTLAPGHPLVRAAVTATRLVGAAPELACASTDANVPLARGTPAIAIGAGGVGGDEHALSEWYENRDGARGLARALTIVMAAATAP